MQETSFYRWMLHEAVPLGTDGATFSPGPERTYRYELWRNWSPALLEVKFIMLNPSTADGIHDDPTIKKCIKFAKTWGFGGLRVVNLFAYRSTDPRILKKLSLDEAVGPDNDEFIRRVLFTPGPNIAAWGKDGNILGRATAVRTQLDQLGIKLQALKLGKTGEPYHPLYLRDGIQPFDL